jgi:hypothetical protein
MIKELDDVLVLVRELPEKHQKRAATELRRLVLQAEEEETMTQKEIRLLRRLESWRILADFRRSG